MRVKVKGKEFAVFSILGTVDGILVCVYNDDRKMSEIVKDWENAKTIERISNNGEVVVYEGYTKIQRVIINDGRVQIGIVQEVGL